MSKRAQDQDVRDRLISELDTSFLVEAAAGTGKTTVLVDRIVAIVKSGRARLGQIMAVTFTEKAAGEMKLRLREALEVARDGASVTEQQHLTEAMKELEVARVGTIHGICADLLREHPVEAEVDPLFEVASEQDSSAVLDGVFGRWFQRVLSEPPEGVRRLLRRRPRSSFDSAPRRMLFSAVSTLIDHRDFDGAWRRDPFNRDSAIDSLIPRLRELGAVTTKIARRPDDSWFIDLLNDVQRFVEDLDHREAVAKRDHDGLEALLRDLNGGPRWEKSQPYRVSFEGITSDQAVALRDEVRDSLNRFFQKADADLAACLHEELWPIVAAYETEKAQTGRLDFVDLLLRTRDLVRQHPKVRAALQARFTHVFVDEFQDTDPLQTEIVLLLCADDPSVHEPFDTRPVAGKLFAVGDPKQSIYRFRRADIQLYERVKRHLASHGAQIVWLSTSFRSTPGIQRAVNGSFERVMTGGTQAEYVALQPWREPTENQPSFIALGVPKPFGNNSNRVRKDSVEACVPDTVAAFIDFLVNKSGWTVEEDGKRVPVAPRHVCILFTRFRGWNGMDVPRAYTRALEARKVPHVLVGGRSFHAREEVMALRTALSAIERPDDELSVYATLKGPFFALTDERLLVFRTEVGKLHPLRPLELSTLSEASREVAETLAVLGALHKTRNRRPVADTVYELLERARAFAGVAFWNAGDQALANLLQVADLARKVERRATSFRDVVDALQDDADEGESPEAPIVEEGTEGVRMMTVHAAKGLEFPVVIFAEPTANASRRLPSHWIDPVARVWAQPLAGCTPAELNDHADEVRARDREEALRVAYVAATRASDLLVIPAIADQQLDDVWTAVLFPSLYPLPQLAGSPDIAPGCPRFGADTVTERMGPMPGGIPIPGLHRAQNGKHRVVWFDPNALELNREDIGGLQRHEALDGKDEEAAQRSVEAWQHWQTQRTTLIAAGERPTLEVVTPKDLLIPRAPHSIRIEDTGIDRSSRPHGRRFGALVHGIMSRVPFNATHAEIEKLTELEGRLVLATEEERNAAIQAVEAALAHPVFRAVAALPADRARREYPILNVLPNGNILEGYVDLAFDDGTQWTVVELKTDDELSRYLAEYQAQTEAYVDAVRAATGRPTSGILLRV